MIFEETIRDIKTLDDLTIMDDYMASRIFTDRKVLSGFLSILLGHPVNIIHCQKQAQARPGKNAHYVIFDILAMDDHGNIYNLEIQDYDEKDFILRLTYNAGVLISMSLQKGKKYKELKNTNVIALCSSDPVGDDDMYYDCTYPFENYPRKKMKPRTRMIALNARGMKSSGNMDIDLLMDYIKTNRRNNGRLTVLLDDARLRLCNDKAEQEAFMKELYQGQRAGDRLARKQVKEMKKEIERIEKENDQIKEVAAKDRKRYEEEKKNSALRLHEDGMDIKKIAGILDADPRQVSGWIVSENEPSYNDN